MYASAFIPAPPFVTPDNDPGGPSFGPDIAVPLNSTDYFARHDPMLAAALARFPGAPPAPTGSAIAVNGASFRVERGLASSSFASVFDAFPAGVDGVLVNGQSSAVVAASTSQVNFVVPASVSPGLAAISVRSGGNEVANGQVTVTPTGPGIFVLQPADPTQPGAVLNHDSSVNSSSHPAAAGSVLQIFATGYGPLDSSQQAPVQVYLGYQPANVLYSAPSAQYPGLWQINAQLPGGLAGQVSLFITLQWGPQHGRGIGQAIRHSSDDLLLIERGSLRRSTVWKRKVLSPPSGRLPSSIGAPSIIGSPRLEKSNCRPNGRNGAVSSRRSPGSCVQPEKGDGMLAPGDQDLSRRDRDLDDEIGFDLALEVEEGIRSGLSREQAEQWSRRDFGNALSIKESIRETWNSAWIERFAQDLRFAARSMRRSPGFTAPAVCSLALGIGSAIALFSIVSALPAGDPNARWRLEIRSASNPAEWAGLRASDYSEIAALPAVSDVVAMCAGKALLTGRLAAESLRAGFVSADALELTGTRTAPLLGRGILASDWDSIGQVAPVVVLGYQAWQRWFRGRAKALGEALLVDGTPHHVIGVMPPGFSAWGADLWLPLSAKQQGFVSISVRLRPGVSPTAAERELREIFSRLASSNPGRFPDAGWTAKLHSDAQPSVDGSVRYAFGWLAVVVSFLLLIACANVANLQLARLSARSGEIAVRTALGAGAPGCISGDSSSRR